MKKLVHFEIETDSNAQKSDIEGMSRVGYLLTQGKTLEIYVNTNDPGKIPHFHIRDKDNWGDFHTCVRIDKAEYFKHGTKCDSLNMKEKKALQEFMYGDNKHRLYDEYGNRLNNWQYICMMWDDNNSDVEIAEETIQPDYTQLAER